MAKIQRHLLTASLALTAIVIYYLVTTLPHEIFGAWLNKMLLSRLDRPAYEYFWLLLTLVSLTIYLFFLFRGSVGRTPLPLLLWWLSLSLASWQVLFVTNIEMIHLLQYATMAYLLGFLIRDHKLILIWSSLLGAIDEGFQYLVLAPDTSMYFDFNDVLINVLGAGFGVIYLETKKARHPRRDLRWITALIFALLGIVLIISHLRGIWCMEDPSCSIVLLKGPIKSFWQEVPPGLSFHQMHPWEGSLLISLTLISFILLMPKRK
jgi:hypothetical protein